jgi:DNA-binding transcriptional LysR family regulator
MEVLLKDGLDLNDLRLLFYVVDCGGFSAASKALSIPTSTISQRIAALEKVAGTGLLRRTTRSNSLTDAGKRMVAHARAIEEQARDAQRTLLGLSGELSGTIRVSSSIAITQFALAPILPNFLRQYPEVNLCVDVSNRTVDLVAEGYDVGIRAHTAALKDSSLTQRVIARTPWSLAAAPDYLDKRPAPVVPVDLATAQILYFGSSNGTPVWELWRDSGAVEVELQPTFCCDEMAALRIAAINGGGIVGLPTYVIDSALKQGQLVPVLAGWRLKGSSISILTLPRRQTSRLTKCFTDFLAAELPVMTNTLRGSRETEGV